MQKKKFFYILGVHLFHEGTAAGGSSQLSLLLRVSGTEMTGRKTMYLCEVGRDGRLRFDLSRCCLPL